MICCGEDARGERCNYLLFFKPVLHFSVAHHITKACAYTEHESLPNRDFNSGSIFFSSASLFFTTFRDTVLDVVVHII